MLSIVKLNTVDSEANSPIYFKSLNSIYTKHLCQLQPDIYTVKWSFGSSTVNQIPVAYKSAANISER